MIVRSLQQQQLYILLFIFNENARENLLATKRMGGGKGLVGQFIVMVMVTAMAMAATTTAMIDWCSFHDSDGTIAAIMYFYFYI